MPAGAKWIWIADKVYPATEYNTLPPAGYRKFRKEFTIPSAAVITSGSITINADNAYELRINGSLVDNEGAMSKDGPDNSEWQTVRTTDCTSDLQTEPNTIEVRAIGYFNWGSYTSNPAGLFYQLTYTYEEPDIEKTMASDGYLGDIITVTLDVENPYGYALTVQDVIPDGLKYIPGSYSGPGTPTVVDDTLTVSVGQGDHQITFDVQVVEVQCEEVTVTNTARLLEGIAELDSDSEDITLWPYEGFEKTFTIVHEDNLNGAIEVNELVQWDMTITVPNNVGWVINDAVLKDNLGGELGLAGDGVNNDRLLGADDGALGDLALVYNTIPLGNNGTGGLSDLIIKTKGKTKKVQFKITDIDVGVGGSLDYVLGIFTDRNLSRWGQQCYTSTYEDHPLNSGATLKFTDPATGFQLSAHTPPITVEAYEPEE